MADTPSVIAFREKQKLDREQDNAQTLQIRWISDVLANPTQPKWLLRDILEQEVIGLIAGPRGTFKSFIALHWAMQVALTGRSVLIVSAEGSGIDRRIKAWLQTHAPDKDPNELKVAILERRVNFNDPESVAALCQAVDQLEIEPSLIVIDTLSKNSGGLDENSNSEVKAFIGLLDNGLKRKYRCTVLLVHHTGHVEKGRARGASALEADTDAAYIVNRVGTERIVTVTRERFKDSIDQPPLNYEAQIVDLDLQDEDGQPITSMAIQISVQTCQNATSKKPVTGQQQKALLRRLRQLQDESGSETTWTISELRTIARDCGMAKSTAQHAVARLCEFYLVTTLGGYRLERKDEQ